MVSRSPEDSQFFLSRSFRSGLSQRIPRHKFESWFADARFEFPSNERLYIFVPSSRHREQLESEFFEEIRSAAHDATKGYPDISFFVRETSETANLDETIDSTVERLRKTQDEEERAALLGDRQTEGNGVREVGETRGAGAVSEDRAEVAGGEARAEAPSARGGREPGGARGRSAAKARQVSSSWPVDPTLTFGDFVVGSSNRLAHANVLTIAEAIENGEQPGVRLLLVIGPSGLGKTHLLQAAYNRIVEVDRSRVLFLSGEQFLSSCRSGENGNGGHARVAAAFRESLERHQTLIIDDITPVKRLAAAQETLAMLIDRFADAGKQLILSAPDHPTQLEGLSDRLRSRLVGGYTAEIAPLDAQLREQLLQKIAQDLGLPLGENVAKALVHGIDGCVRRVEGVLRELKLMLGGAEGLAAGPIGRDAGTEDGTGGGRSRRREGRPGNLELKEILLSTAGYFGKSSKEIRSKRREKTLVRARQVAMYVARENTDCSFQEIGRFFGKRDHATVIHAVRKIRDGLASDLQLQTDVRAVLQRLRG